MIRHLSAEQISQWMIGERIPEIEQHVAECDECREELAQMKTALADFRGAMRGWSESAAPPQWRSAPRTAGLFGLRLMLAAAVVILAVSLPLYWGAREREHAAEAARADAQLLEQVDSEISRAVPEPMEPLISLVTWNSSPAEQNQKVERR